MGRRVKQPKVSTQVFYAIADPTRREIIHLLAVGSALSINEIADHFPATRQGVTKHIRILADAGLIEMEARGREKICRPRLSRLEEVAKWAHFYADFWQKRLDDLGEYLDRTP